MLLGEITSRIIGEDRERDRHLNSFSYFNNTWNTHSQHTLPTQYAKGETGHTLWLFYLFCCAYAYVCAALRRCGSERERMGNELCSKLKVRWAHVCYDRHTLWRAHTRSLQSALPLARQRKCKWPNSIGGRKYAEVRLVCVFFWIIRLERRSEWTKQ